MGGLHWVLLQKKRSRPRSRSRSRSRTSSQAFRKIEYRNRNHNASSDGAECWFPPETFTFIYRTSERNCESYSYGFRMHIITIPSKELKFFQDYKPKWFNYHMHNEYCDPNKFRDITNVFTPVDLGLTTNLTPLSSHSLIGTDIYSLYGEVTEKSLEFWCHTLDSVNNSIISPTLLPTPAAFRYFPTCFALGQKFYIWGRTFSERDELFGEVYDPQTNAWSSIKAPPDSDPRIGRRSVFVASLGEDEAKVLVCDYYSGTSAYLYDVTNGHWILHGKVRPTGFDPWSVYRDPVLNKDDDHLYWIERRGGFMYALDWKNMYVYVGPIVGTEHMDVLKSLKYLNTAVSLHHLWGEFFCLLSTLTLDFRVHNPEITENHYTFLRVVRYSDNGGLLAAFVLGCFMDSRPLSATITDVIYV